MKIINGRWMKDEDTPIDNFNVSEFVEIGKKVNSLYGKEITYERIEVVTSLQELSPAEEFILFNILQTKSLLT